MAVSCIDISHHQGDHIDFKAVRQAGVVAMIHKATEGTSFKDPNRAKNCSAALQAGIAIATYHWLSPGSDPVVQMKFYLSVVQPVVGERLVIDYEQNGCTLGQLETAVRYLLDDDRGFQITIYSGHLLKEQLGNSCNDLLAQNTDLWLAQYTSSEANISWPEATYETWTLWQYSDTGHVAGISDNYVDLNNFNGTNEALIEWISPVSGPRPEPEAEFTTTGRVSYFGGPKDHGVAADEGLALINHVDDAPQLFLPYQPDGTTGLARRLNPFVHYVACRWDYNVTPKSYLRDHMALVRNPKTGMALKAFPADWGPNAATGRVADVSRGLLDDLGLETDDEVEVIFPYQEES